LNALAEPLERVLDRAPASWRPLIDAWRASAAGQALIGFVAARQSAAATIYPAHLLRALELTPRERVRVVILGQDPYHGPDQAEGLAFSVPRGQRLPPSLRNVFRELQRDVGLAIPAHGHLGAWARQGVLLLNTTLSVERGLPGAHAKHGWEALTDEIILAIAEVESPSVFMLWGAQAQAKAPLLAAHRGHLVLQSNHPSPLSASRGPQPFLGSGHFSAANRYLTAHGVAPIDWRTGG
jgi:uracil-DNA glycosylase